MKGSGLFGNAAIYLGANVLNAGIPLILLPLLTRILTPADYGTVAMFGVMMSIFGAFAGLSVHGAVSVRYFQLPKHELAEYVGACVGILITSTTAMLIAVAIFGPSLARISGVPSDWLALGVALSGIQFLTSIRLALWQVAGRARAYGALQVTQSFLNAVASVLLILLAGMAWQGRVVGQAIAIASCGMLALCLLVKEKQIAAPKKWYPPIRDALRFGVPLVPHALGGLLVVSIDRFVIVKLLDIEQAGIYMVAFQISQVVAIVAESFNKSYAPWLMKRLATGGAPSARTKLVRGTYAYFVGIVLGAIAFGLATPLFLPILVGGSFHPAGTLVMYLSVGWAFAGCYCMVANYVFYESKTSLLALVTFLTGLINIPLTFALVHRNGIAGAAQAFALSQILAFALTWYLASNVHPMPWFRALRPIRRNVSTSS